MSDSTSDSTTDQVQDAPKMANGSDEAATGPTLVIDPIAALEAQVKEKENKYLYLYAEFDNFKKRAIKERSDLIKFGWESVARNLLGVLDNMDRAVAHMPAGTDTVLKKGMEMIAEQFKNTMTKQGVQEIQTFNQVFDPNLHEAVTQENSDLPQGTIVKEHAKGYTLHGRLLRPAQVGVSSGKKTNET